MSFLRPLGTMPRHMAKPPVEISIVSPVAARSTDPGVASGIWVRHTAAHATNTRATPAATLAQLRSRRRARGDSAMFARLTATPLVPICSVALMVVAAGVSLSVVAGRTTSMSSTHPAIATFLSSLSLYPPLLEHLPESLDGPTPCGDFAVSDLLAHMNAVIARLAAVGATHSAGDTPTSLPAQESWAADWKSHLETVEATWPELAGDQMVELGWATLPASVAAGVYTAELVLHSWDLARATKQSVSPTEAAVELATAAYEKLLPVADRSQMWAEFEQADGTKGLPTAPFANAHDAPAGATAFEELIAWSGRNPHWSANV